MRRSSDEMICADAGLFDSNWYLEQNPDVAKSRMDPIAHYVSWGASEGRDPNPLFDSDWYLEQNPDVAAAGMNALVHYIRSGAAEGRNPGPLFDTRNYLIQNPEVAASGVNPLAHYIRLGMARDRASGAHQPTSYRLSARPTISAVIPCYNGARWLADALQSVRAQSLPVHEIIVVDDASVDGSGNIAKNHGAKVIRNSTNRGEGFSRNAGLKEATGELIAWLDADDMWMPHHVSTVVGLLQQYPRATAAFGAVERFGLRSGVVLGNIPPGPPSNVFWAAFSDWVHATIASVVHRAALVEIGGFDEEERYSVDFDLWLRLSRSHLFVCTHEVTSRWRWHDAQQSAHLDKQIAALYRFRRRYWERERAAGRVEFAAQIQRRMIEMWQDETSAALESGDPARLHRLDELGGLVPEIAGDVRSKWALQAEVAKGGPVTGQTVDPDRERR
jgi:glycosyltransferase involved in cell wall biosynthesis